MVDNIVVFSSPEDIHAYALRTKAESIGDVPVSLIDNSRFPSSSITVSLRDESILLVLCDEERVQISKNTSVWWRRPQRFSPAPEISDHRLRRFVASECSATVEGAICAAGCFMINDMYKQRRAENKLLQLKVASDIGLKTPKTIVTNCVDEARRFYSERGERQLVFKGQTSAFYHLGETRLVDESILAKEEVIVYRSTLGVQRAWGW